MSNETMKLTKFGHSCVRVSAQVQGGQATLTIDPGAFSDAEGALEGTDAVLLTHGHPDHVDPDVVVPYLLAHPGVPLYGPADIVATLSQREDAAGLGDRLIALEPETDVEIAGVPVHTVGGQHALIHPLIRTIDNLGLVLDGRVYHPGDALTVPAGPADLELLLVPVWAPWSKTAEVVDFIAAVRARKARGIHDAPLGGPGHAIVESQLADLGGRTGTAYEAWETGQSITV